MVQSPIAITLQNTKIYDKVEPLTFSGHWTTNSQVIIENTGKSAQLSFLGQTTEPYIKGGPLPCERYIFEQLHFHWSENDCFGSEHRINERTYSMEAHLVHFNEKYGNFDTAVTKTDGLAVVAFFIQAFGNIDCKFFSKITEAIRKIRAPGTKYKLNSGSVAINLADWKLEINNFIIQKMEISQNTFFRNSKDCLLWIAFQELNKHYYTYSGSLTTPPYNECVTWIIYQTPILVSKQQVAVFRDLLSDNQSENIRNNCRPIQTMMPNSRPLIAFTRNVIQTKSKL